MSDGTAEDALAEAQVIEDWYHTIDLGSGVRTEGRKSAALMRAELAALRLPTLAGTSVLDVGAWDGGFSFACEDLGAREVVALDSYVWNIDPAAKRRYKRESELRGIPLRPWHEVPEVWRPDERPGMRPFLAAKEARGSVVRPVYGDFETMDLSLIGGPFDIVLFLGVLYHLVHPVEALHRLAEVTGSVAVIETQLVRPWGPRTMAEPPFLLRVPGSALEEDPTDYWFPTAAFVGAACRAAGFTRVEVYADRFPVSSPGELALQPSWRRRAGSVRRAFVETALPRRTLVPYRAVIHAWK